MQVIISFMVFLNLFLQKEIDTTRLKSYSIKGEKYWFGGFNEVYKIKEDSLVRIDNSLDSKMFISPYIFQVNDTVVKYGGYGFWSQRNFMIYFDLSSLEWEYYKSKESDLINGSFHGLQNRNVDKIIFFGGKTIKSDNRIIQVPSKEVVEFNFNTRELNAIGKLDFEVIPKTIFYNSDDLSIVFDEEFLYKLDPFSNTVEKFHRPKVLSFFKKAVYDKKNGTFIVTHDIAKGDQNVKINLDENFLNNPIETTTLYNEPLNYYWIISIITSFFVLIITLFNRKNRGVVLTNNSLIVRGEKFEIKNDEYIFLKSILVNGYLPFNSVYEIFQINNLTYAHNTRITNEKIEKISLRLKSIFKLKNVVLTKSKSTKDRRLKNVVLSEEFKKLRIRIK